MLKKYVTTETVYAPPGNESICHIKLKNRSYESENRGSELGILTQERKFVQTQSLADAWILVHTFSLTVSARISNPGGTGVTINK